MYDLIIKNARLVGKESIVHIGIKGSRFAVFSTEELAGGKVLDAKGDMVLPPFVEMHTHLDTALTIGGEFENRSGTLAEGIQVWQERKKLLSIEDVADRAEKVLMMLAEHGVLYVRAAVDISDPTLTALSALLQLREKLKPVIELQLIAFPQDGIISCPDNQERMRKAIELGADAVSAVPHLENTRENGIKSLEFCYSIAQKYQSYIHIFCDETDDPASRFLETAADLALKHQLGEKTTISHVNALAYYPEAYASKVIPLTKRAGLSIVSCPLVSSVMQGRQDPYPKGRGITRLKELNEAGVNLCIAHDDIQTPFYPFGNGNILQAAYLAAHLAHMTGSGELKDILQMITCNSAKAFGLDQDNYGLDLGKPASFVTIPAASLPDLFCNHPACRYVFKDGQLIVSTSPKKTHWESSLLDSSPLTV